VGTLSTGKTAVVLKPQRHRTEVYIYMHARTQSSSLNQAHHIACWNSTISGTLNQHDIQQQQDVAGERRTPGLSYLASCTWLASTTWAPRLLAVLRGEIIHRRPLRPQLYRWGHCNEKQKYHRRSTCPSLLLIKKCTGRSPCSRTFGRNASAGCSWGLLWLLQFQAKDCRRSVKVPQTKRWFPYSRRIWTRRISSHSRFLVRVGECLQGV
jgi:hypothetical protein